MVTKDMVTRGMVTNGIAAKACKGWVAVPGAASLSASSLSFFCRFIRGHTALSDRGNQVPYILHGVYCLKDRESRSAVSTIPT